MLVTTPPLTNNAEFGLQNKNSASERIGQIRATQQRVVDTNNQERNLNSDGRADFGLQDRNGAAERLTSIVSTQQRVVENHGYEAKRSVKEALTNNTKIINIPVQRRGSLIDVSV